MISSGYFAPPWETKYAGPVRGPSSTGVLTVASPTLEATGQLLGFSANTFSVHAFCSVFNGDGSCLGRLTLTFATFALVPCAPAGSVRLTCRLAPSVREVFALVETLNSGLNESAAQFVTWNGVATFARRAFGAFELPGQLHRFAAGRVEHEPRPVDRHVHVLQLQRDPIQDRREPVAHDRQMRIGRIHIDLRADDLGPQVERARDRRDHDVDPERVALIRAGDVRLPRFHRVGVAAEPGARSDLSRSGFPPGTGPTRPAVPRTASRPATRPRPRAGAQPRVSRASGRHPGGSSSTSTGVYPPACTLVVPASNPGWNGRGLAHGVPFGPARDLERRGTVRPARYPTTA